MLSFFLLIRSLNKKEAVPVTRTARPALAALLLAAAATAAPASWWSSAPVPAFALSYKDGRWNPATLTVPSGVKIRLALSNEGSRPVEFESFPLHRELIVPAGGRAAVFVGPLSPGSYGFFDDFHREAVGTLVAAPAAEAR
jgi:hypothetical protein